MRILGTERRSSPFQEKLSLFMVIVAALGAAWVLVDPKITLPAGDVVVSLGGGFSNDLKGAVISAILIGGWSAVKEYWLGSSAGGEKKAEAVSRIAEAAAPAAAAVAERAAGLTPLKTDNLTVDAAGADININQEKP